MSADPRQQQGERVRGPRPGIHVAEATSSVLHCHGVLALRDRSLSEALLAVLEGVRLVSRQFRKRRLALWAAGRGPIRTSLPWCFGSARPVFKRSFTGSAGRCETSF